MALFRRRQPRLADDDQFILALDAELTVLRFVIEQLLLDIALAQPVPEQSIRTLFEAVSTRLDYIEARGETPYREQRVPLLRVELERLVGSVTKALDKVQSGR